MPDADLAFAGAAAAGRGSSAPGRSASRELVELYLDRIARHDPDAQRLPRRPGRPGARAEADAVDARRAAGEPGAAARTASRSRSRTTWTSAGEVTARGSIAHDGRPGRRRRRGVARLRAAGAVVLGKTNVPELMTMPFTETLWYGATRNPWDLDRTPGGSCGGSGAAVAAGLCAAATGVRRRGLDPHPRGLLRARRPQADARAGVPTPARAWRGLSTYGFVTRTVRDAALLYDGHDRRATSPTRRPRPAACASPGR